MKFFETYFTRHHLVHTPHKWFVALLLSPIHAAEVHYKQRYHLTFAHAKKLFVMDITLLASMVALLSASIYWFAYDPTVTDQVRLSFISSEERVKSGDYVIFTLTYKNTSDVALESPSLSFRLPPGFIVDTEKNNTLDPQHPVVSLPTVEPQQEGAQILAGWFYGQPGEEISTVADFSYNQPERAVRESKTVRLLSTLRGSVVETALEAPDTILQSGSVPVTITIKNTSDHAVPPLSISLSQPETGMRLHITSSSEGAITETDWRTVDGVAPEEIITLHGTLVSELPSSLTRATYTVTPSVVANGATIPQAPITTSFTVVRPFIEGQAGWSAIYGKARESSVVIFTLTNNGSVDLKNVKVSVDLPIPVVDMARFREKNGVQIEGSKALFASTDNPTLATLKAGQSISLPVTVPIKSSPQGTDIALTLSSVITAEVVGVPGGVYETTVTPPSLPIGTSVGMSAEIRYYTDEGDQLGRGPLPPIVGKETKYWALVQITNASSNIEDVRFRATLPAHVSWTGRTSVSHGKDISFDAKNRTVSWNASGVAAHTTVGLYIELAVTPTAGMVGTSPTLIENISVSAQDSFTDQPLSTTHRALDTSIPTDEIGRQRGTTVVE